MSLNKGVHTSKSRAAKVKVMLVTPEIMGTPEINGYSGGPIRIPSF